MPSAPPRVLVLDFGGFISRTLFESHPETEQTLCLPAGTLTWRGPFAPETKPLWQSMPRGEVSERDYWLTRSREVGALLGETGTEMQQLVQRARGTEISATLRPEAIAEVAQRHAKGRLLLVHEGGYCPVSVPFWGLATIEELSRVKTGVPCPFTSNYERVKGQALQPEQQALIEHLARHFEDVRQRHW